MRRGLFWTSFFVLNLFLLSTFGNMFNTVLYNLRSAKNIGLIARSHIAFGGDYLVIIAPRESWKFNGGQHSYTRQLQEQNKLVLFENFEEFLNWNRQEIKNVSVEIDENAPFINKFDFPEKCNLIFGGETGGIPKDILQLTDDIVTIPQVGKVGSINVAQSAAIVQYTVSSKLSGAPISGNKFVG